MDYIDSFSVHSVPQTNVRAAIVTKTNTVFREANHLNIATVPDGRQYVTWGDDDMLPYNILDLIEADETVSTCQIFNAEVLSLIHSAEPTRPLYLS